MRFALEIQNGNARASIHAEVNEMKYLFAWILGVPGILIFAWFIFRHV
jgi:hypothetical protein